MMKMQNMQFLKENASLIYSQLVQEETLYPCEIHDEANNNFSIIYKDRKCYANSIQHRREEFSEMFEHVSPDTKNLVVIGIANGEVISFIKNINSDIENIFFVEPFFDVFKNFLCGYDIKDIMSDIGRVTFILNKSPEASVKMITDFLKNDYYNTSVVCHASYVSLLEEWIRNFKVDFVKAMRMLKIHYTVAYYHSYDFTRNSILNARFMKNEIWKLRKKIENKPVIIVGAGPSLNKHIEKLRQLKGKAIIVAIGTSMRLLAEASITPDYQFAVDKIDSDKIYNDVFYMRSKKIPLIYAGVFASTVLEKYEGEKYHINLGIDTVSHYIYKKLNKEYKIITSGSAVTVPAIDAFYSLGAEKIVLLGQDMCFYDKKLYAEGRKDVVSDYNQEEIVVTKDIYGNDVETLKVYQQIKFDVEVLIKDMDKSRIINATEGGLGFDGIKNSKLDDIEWEVIEENNYEKTLSHHDYVSNDKVMQQLTSALEEVENILVANKEKLSCLETLELDFEKDRKFSFLKNKLEECLSNCNKELVKSEFYKTVVLPSVSVRMVALRNTYNIKNADTRENLNEIMSLQYNYARELEKVCTMIKSWLEEVVSGR